METNLSPATGENSNESGTAPAILPVPESTFEQRLQAVERMKANLIEEGKTRLNEIRLQRERLNAEEAHLRDFLGLDKGPAAPPEPEKKPKAPRGSVRGPVQKFYLDNSHQTTADGALVAYPASVVAEATGLDVEQVQGAAAKLAKDGLLERVGKSAYRWKAQAA